MVAGWVARPLRILATIRGINASNGRLPTRDSDTVTMIARPLSPSADWRARFGDIAVMFGVPAAYVAIGRENQCRRGCCIFLRGVMYWFGERVQTIRQV